MTRDETIKILMVVQAAYPNYKPQNKTVAVNVWTEMLSDIPYEQVSVAVKAYIQTNTSAAETFTRLASTGSTISLTKVPDIWGGTGKIAVAKCETAATDPGDITETVAAGDLTHDVLKTKINDLLALAFVL